MRVWIFGGTDLPAAAAALISNIAYAILNSIPAVIVTGGFRHSNMNPGAISTDAAALRGARDFANKHGIDLKHCYEAWIPEPTLDSRPDVGGAVRMSEADGIALQVMKGRTPLGRRLAMVAGVDVVITISGKQHTEVVLEQALYLGLPVLPIPNAGGDSMKLLSDYKERIAANFAPGTLDQCLDRISQAMDRDPERAAGAVAQLIQTAKVGRCLVLMPYDDAHDAIYKETVEPAVAEHMIPVRLDRLPSSEAIYTNFVDAMQSSSAIIADITTLNLNVMYEIGFAHGRGLKPLIFTRDAARLTQLPVYIRNLNVRLVSDEEHLYKLIEDYLGALKTVRRG